MYASWKPKCFVNPCSSTGLCPRSGPAQKQSAARTNHRTHQDDGNGAFPKARPRHHGGADGWADQLTDGGALHDHAADRRNDGTVRRVIGNQREQRAWNEAGTDEHATGRDGSPEPGNVFQQHDRSANHHDDATEEDQRRGAHTAVVQPTGQDVAGGIGEKTAMALTAAAPDGVYPLSSTRMSGRNPATMRY